MADTIPERVEAGNLLLLQRLIAEATVLAGGEHPCAVLGHKWKFSGGRECPFDPPCGASQAVHECESCPAFDFGEPGNPGYEWCASQGFNCGGQR